MFRLSPHRNPRSKGFKVKHALQICLLLGVCVWLLYQVKHSHYKKASLMEEVQSENTIKLGRKDLNPLVETAASEDVRQSEEGNEEENKNEGEEGDKHRESEDERKTGTNDETREREKIVKEAEHEEESMDREKDSEGERHGEASASTEKEDEEAKEKESMEDEEAKEKESMEEESRDDIKQPEEESTGKDDFEKKDEAGKESEPEKLVKDEKGSQIQEIITAGGKGSSNGSQEAAEGLKDGEHKEKDKGTDQFNQKNNSNDSEGAVGTNNSGLNVTDDEKNNLSLASSSEKKGSEMRLESNELLQERNLSAETHDSVHPSGNNTSSVSTKNQSEITDVTTSLNGQNATVDDTLPSGNSSSIDQSNVKLPTSENEESGMKNTRNTTSSSSENFDGSSNVNDNVNASQKDSVDSSLPQEGGTEFSDTNNNVDAVHKDPVDSSVSQEGRAELPDLNNNGDSGQRDSVDPSITREGKTEFPDTSSKLSDRNGDGDASESKNGDVKSVIEGTGGTGAALNTYGNNHDGQSESVNSESLDNLEEKGAYSSTNNKGHGSVDSSSSSSSVVEEKKGQTEGGTLQNHGAAAE